MSKTANNDIEFIRGRSVSEDTIHVRKQVFEALKKAGKDSKITAPDIADALTIECDEVRRALKYFEKRSVVKHLKENRQTSLEGGRPATVWEIVTLSIS